MLSVSEPLPFIVFVFSFPPPQNLRGHPYETIVGYVGVGLAIGGLIFGLFWNIFYKGYDDAAPCPK